MACSPQIIIHFRLGFSIRKPSIPDFGDPPMETSESLAACWRRAPASLRKLTVTAMRLSVSRCLALGPPPFNREKKVRNRMFALNDA